MVAQSSFDVNGVCAERGEVVVWREGGGGVLTGAGRKRKTSQSARCRDTYNPLVWVGGTEPSPDSTRRQGRKAVYSAGSSVCIAIHIYTSSK